MLDYIKLLSFYLHPDLTCKECKLDHTELIWKINSVTFFLKDELKIFDIVFIHIGV